MRTVFVLLASLALLCVTILGALRLRAMKEVEDNQFQVSVFGPVEVLAYTPDDPTPADWVTATGKEIQYSDYSVAVSPDIAGWVGGLANDKAIHVPGYNLPDGFSMINDLSDQRSAVMEILITSPRGHTPEAIRARKNRAMQWGRKKAILKGVTLPPNNRVYWLEVDWR